MILKKLKEVKVFQLFFCTFLAFFCDFYHFLLYFSPKYSDDKNRKRGKFRQIFKIVKQVSMKQYQLASIKDNAHFTSDVFIDENFLLLTPDIKFTPAIKKAVMDWDFKTLYSDGIEVADFGDTDSEGKNAADNRLRPPSPPKPRFSSTSAASHVETEDVDLDEFMTGSAPAKKAAPVAPVPKSTVSSTPANSTQGSEKSRMAEVQNVYNEYLDYLSAIFRHYATHKELNLEEISDTAQKLCVFIKENQRYVLRIQPSTEARTKNFLISHSLRTAVLAITIALNLRMPMSKLVELSVACLLHEIGQIRLPPQLYITDRILSAPERAQLQLHTVLGCKILKENDFPLAIQLGVLEHHERENGTGYPSHMTGAKISLYAKIISVACSFEATTAPRHFREAKSTYAAMIEMLQNNQHMYDETVIKALLYSLSLYPIGAYVYLVNGKIGQVTDVNPRDPRNPIVQVLGATDPHGNPVTVQTDNGQMKIVRVLNKQEAADILKTLKAS